MTDALSLSKKIISSLPSVVGKVGEILQAIQNYDNVDTFLEACTKYFCKIDYYLILYQKHLECKQTANESAFENFSKIIEEFLILIKDILLESKSPFKKGNPSRTKIETLLKTLDQKIDSLLVDNPLTQSKSF